MEIKGGLNVDGFETYLPWEVVDTSANRHEYPYVGHPSLVDLQFNVHLHQTPPDQPSTNNVMVDDLENLTEDVLTMANNLTSGEVWSQTNSTEAHTLPGNFSQAILKTLENAP